MKPLLVDDTPIQDENSSPTKRLRRFDLRQALFILPNAFTLASIFCGFYSIVTSATASPEDAHAFYTAGTSLFLAAFFDFFDGRVARLTKTQSDFGVQMDSLADVISFGVAPSILVYKWALEPFGIWGLLISFLFCACGAIRLARFNVLTARGHQTHRYFLGLPIPGASTMIVSLVIAQSRLLGTPVQANSAVATLTIILSFLMISRVRFRTFKDLKMRMSVAPAIMLIIIAAGAIAHWRLSFALVILVSGYIISGLLGEVTRFSKDKS